MTEPTSGVLGAAYAREAWGQVKFPPDPWWIIMPLRELVNAEKHKRDYVESGMHGLYGLTGFQCIGSQFGQTHTFTYDSDKKEWNR